METKVNNIYTMVARRVNKKGENTRFTFIGKNYDNVSLDREQLVQEFRKGMKVINLGMENGEFVSTNGAMSKYTAFDENGDMMGRPSPVILGRYEKDGELVGYLVFNTEGCIMRAKVGQAVEIHKHTPFANGKIRGTSKGDIISSINGNFQLITLDPDKSKGKVRVGLTFFTEIGSSVDRIESKYAGIIVDGTSMAELERLNKRLVDANAKTAQDVQRIAGAQRSKAVMPLRIGETSRYYVVPVSEVKELIKYGCTMKFAIGGKILVSQMVYPDVKTENITGTVEVVKEGGSLKIAKKEFESKENEEALNSFCAEVKDILNYLE